MLLGFQISRLGRIIPSPVASPHPTPPISIITIIPSWVEEGRVHKVFLQSSW